MGYGYVHIGWCLGLDPDHSLRISDLCSKMFTKPVGTIPWMQCIPYCHVPASCLSLFSLYRRAKRRSDGMICNSQPQLDAEWLHQSHQGILDHIQFKMLHSLHLSEARLAHVHSFVDNCDKSSQSPHDCLKYVQDRLWPWLNNPNIGCWLETNSTRHVLKTNTLVTHPFL